MKVYGAVGDRKSDYMDISNFPTSYYNPCQRIDGTLSVLCMTQLPVHSDCRMVWVNPWFMVFRHLPRVPHYSVVENIMKFHRHDRDSNPDRVKIKHANHYTIGPYAIGPYIILKVWRC